LFQVEIGHSTAAAAASCSLLRLLIAGIDRPAQHCAMDHSDPASTTTSGHGSTVAAPAAAARVKSKVTPCSSAELRLHPDYNWTRSLSERVRGMRDSALGVVWKKRREQKLRGMVCTDSDRGQLGQLAIVHCLCTRPLTSDSDSQ